LISPRPRLLITAVGLLSVHNLNFNILAYPGRRGRTREENLVVEGGSAYCGG
jgi:hypothetical protein